MIFVLLVYPALYGYQKTNDEVYYDMGQCLPEDIDYVIANHKLIDDFDIASTHMMLVDASLSSRERAGHDRTRWSRWTACSYVLGLQSVLGSRVPADDTAGQRALHRRKRQVAAAGSSAPSTGWPATR